MDGNIIHVETLKCIRLDDQRYRLQRSPGISHVIYIVEGSNETMMASLGLKGKTSDIARVLGGCISTQLCSGFSILFSKNTAHT